MNKNDLIIYITLITPDSMAYDKIDIDGSVYKYLPPPKVFEFHDISKAKRFIYNMVGKGYVLKVPYFLLKTQLNAIRKYIDKEIKKNG